MMAGHDTELSGLVRLPNRGFLRLSGPDRLTFLQGLVSNDVTKVAPGHAVYSCLLTPQGKFLHDFFLIDPGDGGDSLLIDCEADRRGDLAQRLKMYKLRSKIEIAEAEYGVCIALELPRPNGERAGPTQWEGEGAATEGSPPDTLSPEGQGFGLAFPDPRGAALGMRILLPADTEPGGSPLPFETYDRLRISQAVPDGSRDMEVGKAILLENNIDLLNGVAWDKGCYTGQELTARTRYRGLIKKRLAPVRIAGTAPPMGTPLIEEGVEVGEMRSASGDLGLALLRLERLRRPEPIAVDGAVLAPEPPPALAAVIAQRQA